MEKDTCWVRRWYGETNLISEKVQLKRRLFSHDNRKIPFVWLDSTGGLYIEKEEVPTGMKFPAISSNKGGGMLLKGSVSKENSTWSTRRRCCTVTACWVHEDLTFVSIDEEVPVAWGASYEGWNAHLSCTS